MKFPNEESYQNFYNNTHSDGPFAKTLAQTSCFNNVTFDGDQTQLTVLVFASKFWLQSVAAISFFTFLLKCASYKLDHTKDMLEQIKELEVEQTKWDGTKYQTLTTEGEYLRGINTYVLQTFMRSLKKLTKNLKTIHGNGEAKIQTIHNRSGFFSVCTSFSGEVGHRLQKLIGGK